MSRRTILLLLLALSAAAATGVLIDGWLKRQRAAQPVAGAPALQAPPPEVVRVLVAKKALPTGTVLEPQHLEWRAWPKQGVVEAYMVEGKAKETDLAGAVVRDHLYPGEPVTAARVVQPGSQGFMAAVLEPGKRAVALAVDTSTGVSGFVLPGDRVDVLLTFKRSVRDGGGDEETRAFSETLLADIRVLAVDQSLDHDGAAKVGKVATLEVSAAQAEQLAVAQEMGMLSLTLRSLGKPESEPKRTVHYTRGTDLLFMMGDPLGVPGPVGMPRRIDVLRGSTAEEFRY